jgi:general secretion pathway protein D
VTDFAPNVVAIYKLLREMDVQPQGKKVKQEYIELQNALAEDIEPILQDLFTGRQRLSPQMPGQPAGGDITDPEPRIIADARTNQIIVYATEDDIVEIKQLVQHLDKTLPWVTQRVHVIFLRNLDAAETAGVLQTLIDGTTLFGASGGTFGTGARRTTSGPTRTTSTTRGPTGPVPPGVATSPEQQEKPTVVADEASNSLIIAASASQFADLKLIIQQIDIRKSQVLIEAALIELSLEDAYRFAVELAGLDDNGTNPHAGPSAFGGTSFGLTEFGDRDGDGLFTDRLPGFILNGGAAPTGAVGGIFAAGQVPLIYRALNTITKTRVLQLPSVVTSDNEEATIAVLEEQATTDNTITSGGNTSGGFGDFIEAGTTLTISPHIADDLYLLLHITLEVSGFQGEPKTIGNVQIPANRFRRNVKTVVTIPDRHTVVIGGLIGETDRSTVDQVPFLGEIPILGNLFKGTNKSDRKTSLFLFLTPTILRRTDETFSDLDRITCERKRKADELIGVIDIPFSRFNCGDRCVIDPATGCVRGSGSASDRLDRLGVLENTRFGGVDPLRLEAEAMARRNALRPGAAGRPKPGTPGRLFADPVAAPAAPTPAPAPAAGGSR